MPDVSVILCTYNRAAELAVSLESLRRLATGGAFEHEVIVVDNNSSDGTKAVVERHLEPFRGRLRYVHEAQPGKSWALNTGIREARGRLLAFTDDDVTVPEAWLASLVSAFATFEADCVYGKILPQWMAPKPSWLDASFYGKLALLDHGEEPFIVASDRHRFFGANFALTKDALAAAGGFNPELGPIGNGLGRGEDTELFLKLLTGGRRIVYQPAAVVIHRVPAERMRMDYFRCWSRGSGKSEAHLGMFNKGKAVFGTPLWAVRKCGRELSRYLKSWLSGDGGERVIRELRLWYYAGLFSERWEMFWRSRGRW